MSDNKTITVGGKVLPADCNLECPDLMEATLPLMAKVVNAKTGAPAGVQPVGSKLPDSLAWKEVK